MKVLHLYAGNLFGGIETYLVTLANTQALMPQMQHEFALCFRGRLLTELQAAGAIVHPLGAVQIRKPWTIRNARSCLKTILQQGTFDVVICHAAWIQAIFGSVVTAQQLPLVFYGHDTVKGQQWIERLAKKTVPNLAIANSKYTQLSLPKLYPGALNRVAYPPISNPALCDRALRHPIRSQLKTSDDCIVIVQACRLEAWKGHQLLLSAVSELKDLPNWEVWIAGGVQRPHEQRYLTALQEQAQTLGIVDRIKFLGQRSDIPQILAAADIHCQPNTEGEPFGIAFIEALYAGLPIVTTEIGAASEIVDRSCGVLVPPNDSQAIAQALKQLITDANARDLLAQAGFARASLLCDPAQQLRKLYEILDRDLIRPTTPNSVPKLIAS
ncbi:MAG TPA: glycosyltransferase family 4 protein [Leptolyngbya sp.]|jgi:glycosyltransferase involved in cell wall biosynthesis|nr:glycosyltransferase family 4 protein [Leptolyngbya sp.]